MLVRRNVIHGFWKEQARLVEEFLGKPRREHPFMTKLLATLGLPMNGFADFIRRSQEVFETSLVTTRLSSLQGSAEIPPLTHRIWLTSTETPIHPPEEYVINCLKANLTLPADALHYFWTNSQLVADRLREQAGATGCHNLVCMDPALFGSDPTLAKVNRLVQGRKFVLAADMLKFLILQRFGGFYSDLGLVYDRQVFDLVRISDYALVVSDAEFFQTSLFAGPPQSDLATIFLAVLNVPSALDPNYALLGKEATALDEVHIFAGLGLTACVMMFMPFAARVFMLPAQSPNLQWRSQESWYGDEPKHGNVLITRTKPTLIGRQEFDAADVVFDAAVRVYGHLPVLRAQLRVLVTLASYFDDHPTRLCLNFFFHGSDKAQHWHNYGYVYNFILGRMSGCIRNVLEVGIGTHNLDVPSSMGVTGVPGASLRAWRETFGLSCVVGADIDASILFQEPGIETYWVDQTRPETIRQLFESTGARQFDLIVDDGLHTFQANRAVMDIAYAHVSEGGMLVIEDVFHTDFPAWKDYLATAGYPAAIVRLPHRTNMQDNCLILIPTNHKATLHVP